MTKQTHVGVRGLGAEIVAWIILAALVALWPIVAEAQKSADSTRELDSTNECTTLDVSDMGTGTIEVTGTWAGTITFYVQGNDGTRSIVDAATAETPGSAVNTTTGNGIWGAPVAGYRSFLACLTTATSGMAKVTLRASSAGGGGGGGAGGAGSSDTTEATQIKVLAAVDSLEANTDTLEANTDLLEGYTLAIAGYLVDIETNTGLTASAVEAIEAALAPESVHGGGVIATGPGIQGEAKVIDGGALPNVVAEGQSARMAMTVSGSPIVTLSNVAGSADVGALILTALQIIDNAETAASHYTYTTDAMTEDEHVVCAAPCTLWSITATNHAATVAFLRCENQDEEGDGAPGTDTLAAATDIDIALPGNAAGAGISGMNFPRGMSFSVGLKCWVVTGEAYDNTDEVGANDVKLLYTYK